MIRSCIFVGTLAFYLGAVYLWAASPALATDPSQPTASVEVEVPLGFRFDTPDAGVDGFSFLWDFGDGTTSNLATSSHIYAHPGTYLVTLTTMHDGGSEVEEMRVVAGHSAELLSFEDSDWPNPRWAGDPMTPRVQGRIEGEKGYWHSLIDPTSTCVEPIHVPNGGGGGGGGGPALDILGRTWVLSTLVGLDYLPSGPGTWFEVSRIVDAASSRPIFGAIFRNEGSGFEISGYAAQNDPLEEAKTSPWRQVSTSQVKVEIEGRIGMPELGIDGSLRLRVLEWPSAVELWHDELPSIDNSQLSLGTFGFGMVDSQLGLGGAGGIRLDEMQVLTNACLPPATAGLVGYWDFENATEIGFDSSGSGRHGDALGGAATGPGRLRADTSSEQALVLDGTGYLQIPAQGLDFSGLSKVTLMSWVKSSTHSQMNVFRAQQPVALRSDGGGVANFVDGNGWETILANPSPPVDRWYHIATVFDQGNVKIYVDGVLAAQETMAFTTLQGNNYSSWAIGARVPGGSNGPDQHFVGEVDDLGVYTRALSLGEIQAAAGRCSSP